VVSSFLYGEPNSADALEEEVPGLDDEAEDE
jgi:hypothetical protein